jgi:outer membrane protein assembly factor BamD (BamD/ComL family)
MNRTNKDSKLIENITTVAIAKKYGERPRIIPRQGVFNINKCALVVIALALTTGCATMQSRWKNAESANTIVAYEEFLKRYPKGELANQARAKLNQLFEQSDWKDATQKNTIQSYENFLKQYPQGIFTEEARSRLESLNFEKAKAINTLAAYEEFLQKYPKGNLAGKVRSILNQLYEQRDWEEASRRNTIESYEEFLKRYPHGTFANEARSAIEKHQNFQAKQNKEDVLVRKIMIKGVGKDRFRLTDVLPKDGNSGRMTIRAKKVPTSWSNAYESFPIKLYPKDSFMGNFNSTADGYEFWPVGHGSIWCIIGPYRPSGYLAIKGYSFVGDEADPLTFILMDKIGLVYLHGKGEVTFEDGRVIKLGY